MRSPSRVALFIALFVPASVHCSGAEPVDDGASGGEGGGETAGGGDVIPAGGAVEPELPMAAGGSGGGDPAVAGGGSFGGAPVGRAEGGAGAGAEGARDRYLVFEGWDSAAEHAELWGVALRGAGQQEPTLLSDGTFDEDLPLANERLWSPDGRLLVFDAAYTDFQSEFRNRFFYVDFRGGGPSPPRPLPNLPQDFPIELGQWDGSGRFLTLMSNSTPYVVDFTGDQPETHSFAPDATGSSLAACRGGTAYVLQGGVSTRLLGLGEAAESLDLGEAEGASISADGRWLATEVADDAGTRLSLRPCDLAGEITEVGSHTSEAPLVFSKDSRYLATTLLSDDEEPELVVVELETGHVIARRPGEATLLAFSRAGTALLARAADDAQLVWRWSDGETETLPPEPTQNCRWLNERVLCELSELQDDDTLLSTLVVHHPLTLEAPVTLLSDASVRGIFVDADERWLRIVTGGEEPRLLELDSDALTVTSVDLREFGAGDYWITDVGSEGETVVQREVSDFELLLFSPLYQGVLFRSPKAAEASIQP